MQAVTAIMACALLVACGDGGNSAGENALPTRTSLAAPVLIPSSDPVIHEYVTGGYSIRIGTSDSTRVWADGRFDCVRDGQLREGRVDPTQIDALLQRLHADGAFGDGSARYEAFGPDAAYDVIDVKLVDRTLHLASWHESAERSPGLVGTDHGIEVLDGRDRDAVLAAQPREYRRFRRIWSDIRSTVDGWVTANGTPSAR